MKTTNIILIVVAAVLAVVLSVGAVAAVIFVFVAKTGSQNLMAAVYVETEHVVSSAFLDIKIDSDAADVIILPSEDGSCRVVFYDVEDEAIVHNAAVTADGTLTIMRRNTKVGLSWIASPRVTLYLPGKSYEKLMISSASGHIDISTELELKKAELEASSGDIYVSELNVIGELEIDTTSGGLRLSNSVCDELRASSSSGKITIEKVKCGDAEIKTTSGKIDIEAFGVSGELETESSSGKQELREVRCAELDIESTSGMVKIGDLIASGAIKIESASGSIYLDECDASELELTSTSGSIGGSLLTDKLYDASSTSGSVRVPKNGSGGRCRIKTSSGSIRFD